MVSQVTVGSWYICAVCRGCRAVLPLAQVMSMGRVTAPSDLHTECPNCGHADDYPAETLQLRQAQLVAAAGGPALLKK